MKHVLFFLFAAFSCGTLAAQDLVKTDTSVILKLPTETYTVSRLKERLVELAMNNPSLKVWDEKKEVTKYDQNRAKAGWLNMFVASGNLNEFTIKGSSSNNTLYPRYNFGLNVPLGNFIAIPAEVKAAKANGRAIDQQKEADKLALKSAVLRAYEDYAANKQLYELQLPLLEDALNHYQEVESKFKQGDQNYDVINDAYRIYNAEKVRKINLERDVKQSKYVLEAIIGTTLEEVLLHL
ncbi:hypothetical protein DCC81_22445 [Chitinophaga parva]|uniref:Transporter n=1 Tax=Chitinophaga parva TaxID=2169414 RepID=A0A2T7BDQ7_9BACT|nr:TolC family protein [Chitinophaga parva]PUZ23160.1 hypothetical protein DCC81_22445 [Chitinophaga parva]